MDAPAVVNQPNPEPAIEAVPVDMVSVDPQINATTNTSHIANPPCSHLPLPDQNESPAAEISTSETGSTSQHQNQSTNEHAAGMKSINPAPSQGSKKSINASPQLTEEPEKKKQENISTLQK